MDNEVSGAYPTGMRQKNPVLVKLGQCIRERRKAKGFSQERFAYEVGLDRTYMGGVERGERNIAVLNIVRIALALNVEVGELFPPVGILKDIFQNSSEDGSWA